MKSTARTTRLVKMAMMVAISCVLLLVVRIQYPLAPFLVYDPADVPIFITTFAFGPAAGMLVTVVVSLLQAFVLGGDGIYGCLMHIIATGTFVIIAGNLYKRNKTRKGALKSMIIGVIAWVIMMCVANYFITPLFMGVTRQVVLGMILPIIIPFNLLKAGINSAITFVLYKRISGFMHKNS